MNESDLNKLNITSVTKTHEEILEMLEEIKEFERKYGEIETEDSIINHELPDIDYVLFEEIEPDLVFFNEIEEKKSKNIEKIRNYEKNYRIFRKKEVTEKISPPKNPTTFRLRINEKGILENIDIKKPRQGKKFKISFRKNDKKESESSEGKSKLGKLIDGLSKIKRIIPKRGKEEEIESEETETSETIE